MNKMTNNFINWCLLEAYSLLATCGQFLEISSKWLIDFLIEIKDIFNNKKTQEDSLKARVFSYYSLSFATIQDYLEIINHFQVLFRSFDELFSREKRSLLIEFKMNSKSNSLRNKYLWRKITILSEFHKNRKFVFYTKYVSSQEILEIWETKIRNSLLSSINISLFYYSKNYFENKKFYKIKNELKELELFALK
jgi:hypothetical protein